MKLRRTGGRDGDLYLESREGPSPGESESSNGERSTDGERYLRLLCPLACWRAEGRDGERFRDGLGGERAARPELRPPREEPLPPRRLREGGGERTMVEVVTYQE